MKRFKVVGMITIIICGLLFLSSEVNSSLGTISGVSYDKNDMFRIQVSNDPFFESIVVDIPNLTYTDLVEGNFVTTHNMILNKDIEFWKNIIRKENSWSKLEWNEWSHIENDGSLWCRDEVRLYTRFMVWL